MRKSTPARRSGLTLIEIVVAVSILAILAGVITPNVIQHIKRAKAAAVVDDFTAIEKAMQLYYADVGSFTPLRDIKAFDFSPGSPAYLHLIAGDGEAGWNGPYLSRMKVESPYGGTYDIDVINENQAAIDLGSKSTLKSNYQIVLEAVNDALDGDGDTAAGVVWGDNAGVHYGVNYIK